MGEECQDREIKETMVFGQGKFEFEFVFFSSIMDVEIIPKVKGEGIAILTSRLEILKAFLGKMQ